MKSVKYILFFSSLVTIYATPIQVKDQTNLDYNSPKISSYQPNTENSPSAYIEPPAVDAKTNLNYYLPQPSLKLEAPGQSSVDYYRKPSSNQKEGTESLDILYPPLNGYVKKVDGVDTQVPSSNLELSSENYDNFKGKQTDIYKQNEKLFKQNEEVNKQIEELTKQNDYLLKPKKDTYKNYPQSEKLVSKKPQSYKPVEIVPTQVFPKKYNSNIQQKQKNSDYSPQIFDTVKENHKYGKKNVQTFDSFDDDNEREDATVNQYNSASRPIAVSSDSVFLGIKPSGVQQQQQHNNPNDERVEFQMHGHDGPKSYKFGYDTGKGKNRQFRFEERDAEGHVNGHYGYYDHDGKVHVIKYNATPEGGFHAEGENTHAHH